MTILVTGGAGYIGSHFVRYLERKKIEFVIVDNFSTGHKKFVKNKKFFELDLKNSEEIRANLQDLDITSIVHFAGLSIVSDSQKMEKEYYENNVLASKNLAKFAVEKKIRKFIYSSSAAVYGIPEEIPIKENHPTKPINNYGKNKFNQTNDIIEMILDLNNNTLKYIVNGNDQGIAFNDILKNTYRLAVGFGRANRWEIELL